jgi:hypothetical protein
MIGPSTAVPPTGAAVAITTQEQPDTARPTPSVRQGAATQDPQPEESTMPEETPATPEPQPQRETSEPSRTMEVAERPHQGPPLPMTPGRNGTPSRSG